MILREIAELLDDAGLATLWNGDTQTGNLFIGNLPEQPSNAILLLTVPSPSPSVDLPTESLSFEVWSRNKSTADGESQLRAIHRLLHRKGNFALPSYYVFAAKSTDAVTDMDQDQQGRKLQKLPMRVLYRDLQLIS